MAIASTHTHMRTRKCRPYGLEELGRGPEGKSKVAAPNNHPITPVWEEEQPLSGESCGEEEEGEFMVKLKYVLISIDWNYRSRRVRGPPQLPTYFRVIMAHPTWINA